MNQPTIQLPKYTPKDTFMGRLKQFVVINHDKLLNNDISTNSIINHQHQRPTNEPPQQNIIGFKSANKVKSLKELFPEKAINETTSASNYPFKQNIQRYRLLKVSKIHFHLMLYSISVSLLS